MVGRQDGQFGDAARGIEREGCGDRFSRVFGRLHEAGMHDPMWHVDLEPVGRVVPRDIGIDPLG